MKSKKGFTLVEILGVIVILGILALLVSTAIMRYFQEGKDTYNENLAKQLVLSAKSYYSDNKYLLPTEVSDTMYSFVTLPTMATENYITKEFTDSEGRECSPSYVFVMQNPDTKDYEYYPCLKCQDTEKNIKDYSTEYNNFCDPTKWQKNEIEEPEETDTPDAPIPDPAEPTPDDPTPVPCTPGVNEEYDEETNTCPCIEGYVRNANNECFKPTYSAFTCKGKYFTDSKELLITSATSTYSINRMYYTTSSNATETNLTLTAAEKNAGKITKKTYKNVPSKPSVFIEDLYGVQSGACDITSICDKTDDGFDDDGKGKCICPSPKIVKDGKCVLPGAPVCSFETQPTGTISKAASFKIVCKNSDVKIKRDTNVKLTTANKHGTLTIDSTELSSTSKTLTVKGKYTPKSGIEGVTDQIVVPKGYAINNDSTKKQSGSIKSKEFKIDTKAPELTYTVTTGTKQNPTCSGSKCNSSTYSGSYKSKVYVKVSCTDKGIGVDTSKFVVAGETVNAKSKTVKKTKRGVYTIKSSCKDKAGHSDSESKTYRVVVGESSCTYCGTKTYKACIWYCKTAETCCPGGYSYNYSYYFVSIAKDGTYGQNLGMKYRENGILYICNEIEYQRRYHSGYPHPTGAECARAYKSKTCIGGYKTSYPTCNCRTGAYKTGTSCGCATGNYCYY